MGVAARALCAAAAVLALAGCGGDDEDSSAEGRRVLEPVRILVQPDGGALVGGIAVARGEGERCWDDERQVREVVFLRLGRDGERRGLVELSQGALGSCAASLGSAHRLEGGGLLVSGWRALGISEGGAERLAFAARLTPAGEPDASFGEGGVLSMADPSDAVAPVGDGLYVSSGSVYAEDGRRLQSAVAPGEIADAVALGGSRVAVAYLRRGAYYLAVVEPRARSGRLPDEGGFRLLPAAERSSDELVRVRPHRAELSVLAVVAPWEGPGRIAVVARHRPDGGLDPGFGRVLVELGAASSAVGDFAVAPDGAVVVAGQLDEGGERFAFLARWTPAGERDVGFGDDGLVRLDLGPAAGTNVYADSRTAVGIRPDGSILLAASVAGRAPAIASYTSEGQLEPSFGREGVLRLAGL